MTSHPLNELDNGNLWVVVETEIVETKPVVERQCSGIDTVGGFGKPDAVSRCSLSWPPIS